MIRIPFSSKSHRNESLRLVLQRTADRSGYSVFEVANLMSYFLDELANEVCFGRAVPLPGFGLFAPWTWTPRKEGLRPYAVPGFYPAKGFRQQVATCCPPNFERNDRILRYRRNHHNSARNTQAGHARVFTAMNAWRAQLRAQQRHLGLDNDGD